MIFPEIPRTNRGLINEFFYGRWRLLRAYLYAMFRWKTITIGYIGHVLVMVVVENEIFYLYGEEYDDTKKAS